MYSVSKLKSDRKPPLSKSSTRLRPRRVISSSTSSCIQTPLGSLTKSPKPICSRDIEESELRPEYRKISCELQALAKMVRDELGSGDLVYTSFSNSCSVNSDALYERGIFYDEYSAKRNERLKRKKGVAADADVGKPLHNLGVTVDSAKKGSSRKLESLRKSVSAAYSLERSETPRYMLRSMTKENKKPPLPGSLDKSVLGGEKKTGARKARRI